MINLVPPSEEPVDVLVGGSAPANFETAQPRLCADCDQTVWLSESSLEKLDRHPSTIVVCVGCFVVRVNNEPDVSITLPRMDQLMNDGMRPNDANRLVKAFHKLMKKK
jgi:hypothetical protein